MILLNNITDDPKQNFALTGENGELIPFALNYSPSQIGWYYDIGYGSFQVNGQRLGVSPNTLYQWQNIIPFGLCCVSVDGFDPYYIDDFSSGRINLFLLSQADLPTFNDVT